MIDEKKSIFDLADKFAMESPFGNDWVNKDFSIKEEPKLEDDSLKPSVLEINSGYYNKNTGDYLGTDGEKNNKVYIADKLDNSKKGKAKFVNSKKLSLTHDELLIYAGTIFAESSGVKEESAGIANTIKNTSKKNGKDVISQIKTPNYAYGYGNDNYDIFKKKSSTERNLNESMKNAIFGVIHVLTGGIDYSDGATGWDGRDLLKDGSSHPRNEEYNGREGIFIPWGSYVDVALYLANVATYLGWDAEKTGEHILIGAKSFEKSRFVVTGSYGQTLFWRASYASKLIMANYKAVPK